MTKNYYKVWPVLQSVTVIKKCDRKLLQSVAGITKWGKYYKVWQQVITELDSYYREWHILPSVAVITKWDVTEGPY